MTGTEASPEQLRLLARLKSESVAGTRVPVMAGDRVAGHLVPIGAAMAEDRALHERLCRWRAEHMASFLTSFIATPEKTRKYLVDFSLPDPRRILFLIVDSAGRPVGNVGLCGISRDEAELDNVLRGEPAEPGLMTRAVASLLGFAFGELGVGRAVLNVLESNEKAIALYKRLGFSVSAIASLWKEVNSEGYVLRPVAEHDRSNSPERLLFMKLAVADQRPIGSLPAAMS